MKDQLIKVLSVLLSVSFVNSAYPHEATFVHTDEYLSHEQARALGFKVTETHWDRVDGVKLTELDVFLPGMITGQMIQAGLGHTPTRSEIDGFECSADELTERFVDPDDETQGWIVNMMLRDPCREDSFVVGVYGLHGAMVFYWISYEN